MIGVGTGDEAWCPNSIGVDCGVGRGRACKVGPSAKVGPHRHSISGMECN